MPIKRTIQKKLIRTIEASPITLLVGARQTGKSTLIKEIASEFNYTYITFDDLRYLSAAQNDPIGFIQGLSKPVIIDEVQRVPEIFLAIKQDIDINRAPGRYVLTGSANPLLIPRLGDSLAGRMEILELMPLSQGELLGVEEQFIAWAFGNQLPGKPTAFSKQELFEKIIIGGYPTVQTNDSERRDSWFDSYITTILYKDVQDLARISGISELPHLLKLLATRAGNLLNMAEISRSAGIASTTLHRYLTLLQTLFIITLQQPWSNNLGKRLVKSPKPYLIDTGLLSFLLGFDAQRILQHPSISGAILENFVQSELSKQISWSTQRVTQYHYRTHSGIEVDIILESAAGTLVGIEIKNSQTVSSSDIKGLVDLQESMGTRFHRGFILYTGSEVIPFGRNIFAIPIWYLWEKGLA